MRPANLQEAVKMKAKSLHFSKSGNVQPIASEIGRVMQCVCDQIPPAYPCEGEKVVFIGVEMNGKLPGAVDHFCKDLNPTRAKGVAFYVLNSNGNTDGLSSIIDTMKKNGVETYGEPLGIAVKGGLFDTTAFIIFHKKRMAHAVLFSVFTGYTNLACGGKLYEKSLNVIFPVKV